MFPSLQDLISAMKLPDSEPLLMEEYIQIADAWRQDWERGVQVPVNKDASKQFKAVVKELQPKSTGSFSLYVLLPVYYFLYTTSCMLLPVYLLPVCYLQTK